MINHALIENLQCQILNLQYQNDDYQRESHKLNGYQKTVAEAKRKLDAQKAEYERAISLENNALDTIERSIIHRHTISYCDELRSKLVGSCQRRTNTVEAFFLIGKELSDGENRLGKRLYELHSMIAANNRSIEQLRFRIRVLMET